MAVEVTVVMRFDHAWEVPDEGTIETWLDCIVLSLEEEEV